MKNWQKLEVHTCAPELNKLHLKNGVVINTPHCTSIKEVRELFKPRPKGLHVTINSSYDEERHRWLNKTAGSGMVGSRQEAINIAKTYFQQSGGNLIDGTTLPPNKLTYKFSYI